MALNVPMQAVQQPIVQSLSDAVGKWTDINNAQQQGQLATQKMDILKSQTARENKLGDFKFATDKQTALKSVMTDVKSKMDDFTKQTGFADGSPEFQQRLNAVYATNADPIMKNITGIPYKQGTNVEWQHINSLAGMTPAETQANEMQLQTAKQDAILRNQMQLGAFNNQYKDQADQRNYEQSVGLEDIKHGHNLEATQLENQWKNDAKIAELEQKANTPKPMSEYQQANFEAKQEAKKLATQGQLATFDTMIDTLDRVKSHKGLDKAVGMKAYIPSIKGTDAYDFEQSLDTLKSQAFVPMVASLKGMGALSDAEGKKLTAAVGELDVGMSKDQFVQSVDRINKDISAAKKRLETTSVLNDDKQTASTPQEIPAGYKMQRNKRTGETRLVKAE